MCTECCVCHWLILMFCSRERPTVNVKCLLLWEKCIYIPTPSLRHNNLTKKKIINPTAAAVTTVYRHFCLCFSLFWFYSKVNTYHRLQNRCLCCIIVYWGNSKKMKVRRKICLHKIFLQKMGVCRNRTDFRKKSNFGDHSPKQDSLV